MDDRNAPAWVTWVLVMVGVVLLVGALVYFAEPAKSLPSFFPAHNAGSNRHHSKYGIALVALAIIAFIGAWFSARPRNT
jgi:hypothetical protein